MKKIFLLKIQNSKSSYQKTSGWFTSLELTFYITTYGRHQCHVGTSALVYFKANATDF